jgi:hypothetical protein
MRAIFLVMGMVLIAPAVLAQSPTPIPPNTLSCDGFSKNPDGTWRAGDTKIFDIGTDTNVHFAHTSAVPPRGFILGGVDLWTLLESKCKNKDSGK